MYPWIGLVSHEFTEIVHFVKCHKKWFKMPHLPTDRKGSVTVFLAWRSNWGYSGLAMISLCHRPRNCNLSNLCGRCKSLAPEIVSWLRGISCASGGLSRLRCSRLILLAPPALVFGSIA